MRRFIITLLSPILIAGSLAYSAFGVGATVSSAEKVPVHEQVAIVPTPTLTSTPIPTPTPQPQTPTAKAVAAKPVVKAPAIIGDSLSIPSIGFQGSIVNVGVTAGNAIDVPATKIGRYAGSAQPGTPGAVFLDGHYGGIFAKLNMVREGQMVSMNFGGQVFNYQVVHIEIVDLATIDMNRALSVFGGNLEGLNIMTCAGTYIPSAGTYNQRPVVYAVRTA